MTGRKIKVFVIEDEFYTFDALRTYLSQDPRTIYIGGVQNPREAMKALGVSAPGEEPDVVLLDMRFRDSEGTERLDGIELVHEIDSVRKAGKLDIKILCLSMNLNPKVVISALAYGADGYLDKNQAAEAIVDAVVWAHEEHLVISPNIADRIVGLIKDVRNGRLIVFPEKRLSGLSERTEEVAYLYYRCRMSAKEIADELYIAESTVRSHIKKIKSVLEASSRSDIFQRLTDRRSQD